MNQDLYAFKFKEANPGADGGLNEPRFWRYYKIEGDEPEKERLKIPESYFPAKKVDIVNF